MPAGDRQRTWSPEMVEALRVEWRADMPWSDLIALRDRLDAMLQPIRHSRHITPAGMGPGRTTGSDARPIPRPDRGAFPRIGGPSGSVTARIGDGCAARAIRPVAAGGNCAGKPACENAPAAAHSGSRGR